MAKFAVLFVAAVAFQAAVGGVITKPHTSELLVDHAVGSGHYGGYGYGQLQSYVYQIQILANKWSDSFQHAHSGETLTWQCHRLAQVLEHIIYRLQSEFHSFGGAGYPAFEKIFWELKEIQAYLYKTTSHGYTVDTYKLSAYVQDIAHLFKKLVYYVKYYYPQAQGSLYHVFQAVLLEFYSYGYPHSGEYGYPYAGHYGYSYGYPHGGKYDSEYPGQYGYPYGYSHGYPYGGEHGYPYAGHYGYPHGGKYDSEYAGQYGYPYGYSHGYQYGAEHGYPYAGHYGYLYGYPHGGKYDSKYGYPYGYSHGYSHTGEYSYPYAGHYAHSYGYPHGGKYGSEYGYSYGYPHGSQYGSTYGHFPYGGLISGY